MQLSTATVLTAFRIPFVTNNDQFYGVNCPICCDSGDPTNAKGGVAIDSGAFSCFRCKSKMNLVSYVSGITGDGMPAVQARINKLSDIDNYELSDSYVLACNRLLAQTHDVIGKLKKKGIALETAMLYRLGWSVDQSRLTIPVYDEYKNLVNIRSYTFDKQILGDKKMLNAKGKGKARIYLIENLLDEKKDTVYIAEGELKAILLNQLGFNAIAPTCGAGNWVEEWNLLFKDKDVVIVYDVDDAGRKGATQICRSLVKVAKSVKDVFMLDVADPTKYKGGDITNYIVDEHKTAEDFAALVAATEPYSDPYHIALNTEEDNDPIDLPLSRVAAAEYAGKRVATTIVVSAKDQAPYIMPRRCTVICDADKEYCKLCTVSENRYLKFEVDPAGKEMMQLIGAPEEEAQKILKKAAKIYAGCKASSIRADESINIEELRAIPRLSIGHATEENVVRQVYVAGLGLRTNTEYKVSGRSLASHKDGHAVLIADKAEQAVNDLDQFVLSHDLTPFRPTEWTAAAVTEKLNEIYSDLEANVTRIYHRRDMHLFMDVIWHSPLLIPFQNKVAKGYADGLIIGDSGQGKSEASTRLVGHYRCGERVDCKGASVAGILGGLHEQNGRWFLGWGTIPLNDRRMVILEEVKGMQAEALQKLTDMRSRGIAEINKIEKERTNARTRLLWISNPRGDRKLSEYSYGVDGVKDLIGSLEDIRRFDIVMGVASGEVDSAVLNAGVAERPVCEHRYTSELCCALVHWIWSRGETQVRVELDAEDAILAAAKRLSYSYSSVIPIVEPADQRHKVLRVAAAIAGRTFSTDDQETLVIRRCHVEVAEAFMNRIYSAPVLGYADFSNRMREEETLRDPEVVVQLVRSSPNARVLVAGLLDGDVFNWQEISNWTDWSQEDSKKFIAALHKRNCIKRRDASYRKCSAFIKMLRTLHRDPTVTNESLVEQLNKGEF